MTIEPVTDPRDARLEAYRRARDPAWRRSAGCFVVEGRLLVERLLGGSRFRPRSVLATPGAVARLRPFLDAAPDLTVYVAEPAVLRAVLGFPFHRGCLALAERGPEPSPAPLVAPGGRRRLLVLDRVADPVNVGALVRNARAFGAAGVLCAPGTADPLAPQAIRASAGAVLTLPVATLADWPEGLEALRQAGYALVALAPDGTVELRELGGPRPVPARLALLVGAEGAGLDPAARRRADLTVRIAMAPGVDSLNVAVAAAIALYHLARAD